MDATSQEPPADQDSSTPVVEEEFQFLICERCRNEPKEPKLLSCLHTLCLDCLQENKSIGQCPICQAPILQPNEIPNQDNSLYASLQSQKKIYQKIVTGRDLVCSNCKAEGEFWCFDCEEFTCPTCFQFHQRILKQKSHKVRNVKDLQAGSLKEFIERVRKPCNLFCDAHEAQILSIYCSICCKLKCCICALLDSDHRGQCCDIKAEILRRQEELGSLTKELKQKKSYYESACNNLHGKANQLDQGWKETQELILKKVEQMVKLIRDKGEELLARAERQHQERHQDLKGKMQHMRAMLMRLEAGEQLMEKMRLYASDQVVMDMHQFIKHSLVELQNQPSLAVVSDVQVGDFSKCKAELQALVEQVTGEHEVAPMRSSKCSKKVHFSPSITKKRGDQDIEISPSPAKFIRTEADDGKWDKWATEPNQNILEQPRTSSSTGYGSGRMANRLGAVKEVDLTEPLENNIPQEDASEEKLCEDIKLLMKDHPDDVDVNFVGEIKHFHAYIKQNDSDKGYLCHQDLHQVIIQAKIQLTFPNVETILQLFESNGNKSLRRKVIFPAEKDQE